MKKFINRKERGERPENRERSFNKNKNKGFSDFSNNDYSSKREKSFFGESNEKKTFKKSFAKHKEGNKKGFSSDNSYSPKKKNFHPNDSLGKSYEKPFKSRRNDSSFDNKEHPLNKPIRDAYKNERGKTEKRVFSHKFEASSKSYKSKSNPFEKSFDRKEKDRGMPFKEENPFGKLHKQKNASEFDNRPQKKRLDRNPKQSFKKDSYGDSFKTSHKDNKPFKSYNPQPEYDMDKIESKLNKKKSLQSHEGIRLNRYISNAGVCSRREADELIRAGKIMVNGKVVTELGTIVKRTDKIEYKGKVLTPEKMVYVLLNKPKDYITTTDDPEQRKTVMSLVEDACDERIYPVGRLDRNTTGLLLLTNDGELTRILSHPSSEVKKLYEVEIDKPLAKDHEAQICSPDFSLEDGLVGLDAFEIISPDRKRFGIAIHSGKNRIVRRIFEKFGYQVEKLDRVMYAGLTKKDLPRGEWRYLSEKEVIFLKNFSAKKKKVSLLKELESKIRWEDFED
ncbi:MAG: pseudouridine synthase [Flammeovirgaceae bacterium]